MTTAALSGKTALVTGATSGIGTAIAERFAEEGAFVWAHGRDNARTGEIVRRLRAISENVGSVIGDLASDAETRYIVDAVFQATNGRGVDILVNNAGGTKELVSWFETPSSAWINAYEANVLSAVRLVHAFVPAMKSRSWGRIIQISSVAASQPPAAGPDYSAAKAAQLSLTQSLARVLSNTGITVNAVSPGPIRTEGLERAWCAIAKEQHWPETEWEGIERRALRELFENIVGRVGSPSEIADAVTFLARPDAGYITSVNLQVDGGIIVGLGTRRDA